MNLPLLKEMETQNGAHPLHGLPHLAHPIRATGGRQSEREVVGAHM
jgi:hypothetical protein